MTSRRSFVASLLAAVPALRELLERTPAPALPTPDYFEFGYAMWDTEQYDHDVAFVLETVRGRTAVSLVNGVKVYTPLP